MKRESLIAGGLMLLPLLFPVTGCGTGPEPDDVLETFFFDPEIIDGDALTAFAYEVIIGAKKAPGYTLAVIKDDKLIYKNYAGTVSFTPGLLYTNSFFVNNNTSEHYAEDSTFPLASSTKFFVAAVIFKMVEDGLIVSINDPVKNYISEMHYGDITIFHCLTHSTGINFAAATNKQDIAGGKLNPEWLQDVYTSQAAKLYTTGNESRYSASYAILLDLISRISGETADAYAYENIFKHCGMEDTFFDWTKVDQSRVLMKSQINATTGTEGLFLNSTRADSTGNAGLFSTIDDMANFARMMLNDGMFEGTQVFEKETIDKLAEPVPNWSRAIGAFQKTTVQPNIRRNLFPASAGPLAFGHPGSNGDGIVIDRQNNLAYAIMMNEGTNATASEYLLLANVFEKIYGLLK